MQLILLLSLLLLLLVFFSLITGVHPFSGLFGWFPGSRVSLAFSCLLLLLMLVLMVVEVRLLAAATSLALSRSI